MLPTLPRTCLVAVSRNRYSVPCELARRRVSTRRYPERVVIVAGDAIVANRARLRDPGQTAYDRFLRSSDAAGKRIKAREQARAEKATSPATA